MVQVSESNQSTWVDTAKAMATTAVGIFLQGALFALGGLAVTKIATRKSLSTGVDGNVIPLRRTGT